MKETRKWIHTWEELLYLMELNLSCLAFASCHSVTGQKWATQAPAWMGCALGTLLLSQQFPKSISPHSWEFLMQLLRWCYAIFPPFQVFFSVNHTATSVTPGCNQDWRAKQVALVEYRHNQKLQVTKSGAPAVLLVVYYPPQKQKPKHLELFLFAEPDYLYFSVTLL